MASSQDDLSPQPPTPPSQHVRPPMEDSEVSKKKTKRLKIWGPDLCSFLHCVGNVCEGGDMASASG